MPVSKILLVEDNPADVSLIEEWLGAFPHWNLNKSFLFSDALVLLGQSDWDIVLLDLTLPDSVGPRGIESIRRQSPTVGLIVLTGPHQADLAAESLKLGADDFLIKSRMDAQVLEKSVRYVAHKKRAESAMIALKNQHAEHEKALRKEYQKFQSVFESALDGIVIADDNRKYIDANPAACRIFALSREELLTKTVNDFLDSSDMSDAQSSWNEFRKSASQQGVVRIRRHDGTTRLLEYSATANSLPGQHISILRDVTEQKEAEEERDRIFNVSPDIMCIAGSDGYFKRISPACISILGYTPEEMCARPMLHFIHPDDLEATKAQLEKVFQGEAVPTFENRYLTKSGSYVHLGWKSATVGDRVYATARDNTERNRLQAQLLHADRLVAVGTLAAGVAHEINNPLAFTLANLHLALEDFDGSNRVKEMISLAAEGAERVKDVVAGLKVFSRNDEDRVGLIRIETVMENSVRMAQHEIQPRAKLIKTYGATPLVKGNEGRLGQVFLNILINAAQAIPEGHADENEIRVTLGTDQTGNAYIECADTGPGIPENIKARIFDPFFTTKPVGTGTGLGLAICHGIVMNMGGKITFESKEGRGTAFRITLPPSVDGTLPVAPARVNRVNYAKRLNVVIIDDEAKFAATIGTALKKFHDVSVFTDSTEALEHILATIDFDLILCDLAMPGLTGVEIYERLKGDGRGLEKRLLFMTGGAFTPKSVQFMQNTAIRRIQKPFRISDLVATIAAFYE